jgi:PHD/YefM family antitoxin component YafN of YafNO toxin-antitoxin module
MQTMNASEAKQRLRHLIETLDAGPVAIERHKKVVAIVCTPASYAAATSRPEGGLDGRRAARAAQALVERERLIKHQRWAIELLLMPESQRSSRIVKARNEVARWRSERLCSSDYADRWSELLALPVAELVVAMTSELDQWGNALRQNSPWHVAMR